MSFSVNLIGLWPCNIDFPPFYTCIHLCFIGWHPSCVHSNSLQGISYTSTHTRGSFLCKIKATDIDNCFGWPHTGLTLPVYNFNCLFTYQSLVLISCWACTIKNYLNVISESKMTGFGACDIEEILTTFNFTSW